MKKILSVDKIRKADAYTIKNEPVSSLDLMERAGSACARKILDLTENLRSVLVIAGQGNNGGDGLVIARHLSAEGVKVLVVIPRIREYGSDDFEANLKRLTGSDVAVEFINDISDLPDTAEFDIIVDAIFGSGLTRSAGGLIAEIIEAVNDNGNVVFSIDIPSGLFADKWTDEDNSAIINATVTLTLELPKLCMLIPDCYRYIGDWHIVPIGLDGGFITRAESGMYLFEYSDAVELFLPRNRVAHKGDFGHGILIAGSRNKGGAAILAATAALRSGIGLLTAYIPSSLNTSFNTALPEAMLVMASNPDHLDTSTDISGYDAIAVGPGLGTQPATHHLIHQLLTTAKCPLILDADAINILSAHPDWLAQLPPGSIITPHPKEFERMAGRAINEFQRLEMAMSFAAKHQCFIVLKTACTAVISPDGNCSFNSYGNAGLAKGGSGDTLTGIILGLICRGYEPYDASCLGVYMHARAAELAAQNCGLDAILASDISFNIGFVWKELEDAV